LNNISINDTIIRNNDKQFPIINCDDNNNNICKCMIKKYRELFGNKLTFDYN